MRILIGELCSVSPSSCQCVGNHCLFTGGANSPPQSKVPVTANPAYGQVTSVAVQQNNAYSIVPPPPSTVQYENITKKR